MKAPPPPRAIVPALAGVAGVVVAHVVDYLVVFPNASQRADELATTGHAYWPVAVGAALAAGTVVLMLSAGRGLRRGAAARPPGPDLAAFGWLLGWQALAFVVMETGERAMAGLPPTILLHSPQFWVGLALQVPVAWLARRLLHAVEDVAYRLAVHLAVRHRRPPRSIPLPAVLAPPARVAVLAGPGPRGPPGPRICA